MVDGENAKMAGSDEVIAAIRQAVEKVKGDRVSLNQFLKESGLKYSEVFNHFARWDDALAAARFGFWRPGVTI